MTFKINENPKVLIGSVRSELQYEYCAKKHFYFAPAIRLLEIDLPFAYVAMYHCLYPGTMGIDSYAKVKRTKLVKRRDIPYPMTRNNPNEEYYRFDLVDRWQKLDRPVIYRDETVYAPRETTLGLLLSSRETYELFLINSDEEQKLNEKLKAAVAAYINDNSAEPSFKANEYFEIKVTEGYINLLNRRGTLVSKYSVSSFTEHPGKIFSEIAGELRRVALALEQ